MSQRPFAPAVAIALPALLYFAVYFALDRLRFPLRGDEIHFWPTTLRFSDSLLPSLDLLRSYGELNTPLPFLLWGALEHAWHQGVALPRTLHLLLSFAVTCFIAWPAAGTGRHRPLAALGLLLCPYFLIVSAHLYTDLPAITLTLLAVAAHLRRKYLLAAGLFVLAIAARQYMVAFPAALAAWELYSMGTGQRRPWIAWAAPALATASIGGWFALFGGFAPHQEIVRQAIGTVAIAAVIPHNALYLLACVGLYFALPNLLLYRRWVRIGDLATWMNFSIAAALLAAFVLFPPLHNDELAPFATMGYFDRALHAAGLPDTARVAVFYLFALLALHALRGRMLSLAFVAGNALLMMKAHVAWDKYALPVIVVLWYLESRRVEDAEMETTRTQPIAAAAQ